MIGEVALPKDSRSGSTIELTGLGQAIAAHLGDRQRSNVRLMAIDSGPRSYGVEIVYHTTEPASDERCPLGITTKLSDSNPHSKTVTAGETVLVEIQLTNNVDNGQPLSVAIVGLSGGSPRTLRRVSETRRV